MPSSPRLRAPRRRGRTHPPFAYAILGGTFDRFHAGHRALIDRAFRRADRVGIGITTARFLEAHPKPAASEIETYRTRRRVLVRYLSRRFPARRWRLLPLSDPWGGALGRGPDLLVVSPGTHRRAGAINRERRRRGLPRLSVEVVAWVLGSDRRPIASRRIRRGEVDRRGRVLRVRQRVARQP